MFVEQKYKIAIVTSRFNSEITDLLKQGALAELKKADCLIQSVDVPGAVEIPLAAQALLEAGFDGVVVCGAVIRGDTSHYDLVCNSVERGITELMLQYKKPIGFGVITTENEEQAQARAGGSMGNKGAEAALVTLEMLGVLKKIRAEKFEGKNI